jgi:hypothetical protein
VYATAEAGIAHGRRSRLLLCIVAVALVATTSSAEARQDDPRPSVNQTAAIGGLIAGAFTGFAAHEGGHLLFDVIFDADPGVKRVEFGGIPFFAITHRSDLSPKQEFAVSSAGFWVQNATNEWLLTSRPRLRSERNPFLKGIFAFNLAASGMYSVAAFARIGPDERDTRGMAISSDSEEPWIGLVVLLPAALDAWRYMNPDAQLPKWLSRAAKVGAVLLVLR